MQTNEHGLVPGVVTKTFDIYRKGTVCGFEPTVAQRLMQKGVWQPSNKANATAGVVANHEHQVEEDGDAEKMFLVAIASGTLQIPHNWREQHHTKKKAWASDIYGESVTKVDEADTIIATAVKDQEDALQGD